VVQFVNTGTYLEPGRRGGGLAAAVGEQRRQGCREQAEAQARSLGTDDEL